MPEVASNIGKVTHTAEREHDFHAQADLNDSSWGQSPYVNEQDCAESENGVRIICGSWTTRLSGVAAKLCYASRERLRPESWDPLSRLWSKRRHTHSPGAVSVQMSVS